MERLNVVGVETPFGYRTVELRVGDLFSGGIKADVLVASAFADDLVPEPGTVVGSLASIFGIDLRQVQADAELDLRSQFGCWLSRPLPRLDAFERVMIVEMTGTGKSLDVAINDVFVTLAVAEAKGFEIRSLAMPILGTGSQGLDPAEVIPIILREVEAALHRQHSLERVTFVVKQHARAAALSDALNHLLRRTGVALPKTALIGSLRADLSVSIDRAAEHVPHHHAALIEDLRRIVASDVMRSFEVGIIGRRLAEFISLDLAGPKLSKSKLFERIKALAAVGVSPWIRGYLDMLRVLGNNSAHESDQGAWLPPHVDEDDLTVCLFCMLRVLSFWIDYKEQPAEVESTEPAQVATDT